MSSCSLQAAGGRCSTLHLRPQKPPQSPAVRPAAAHASPEGAANNAVPARFSTRLEHMDTVRLHPRTLDTAKFAELDLAECELCSHCAGMDPDDEPERCWQAYSYLERKRETATAGCKAADPAACAALEHLNGMAHELLATGSMEDLVATFATLARVEELRTSRAAKAAEPADSKGEQPSAPDSIHTLFASMDADGDGRLSMAEFRQGMKLLGDELDGATVALIGDAMEAHGFITEQQLRDIVEAEALNSKSEVMQLWRHHHLSPRPHLRATAW